MAGLARVPSALARPPCLSALAGPDLSAQPHQFPVGLLGEAARIQLLQGQTVPPAHSEPHPLPHARGHHFTCQFSHRTLLGQHPGPQLAGTRKEPQPPCHIHQLWQAACEPRWPGPAPHCGQAVVTLS